MSALDSFIFVLLHVLIVKSSCPEALRVNISNGIIGNNHEITFNDLVYHQSQYMQVDGVIWGCPCSIKACVRKCCPDGKELIQGGPCVPSTHQFDIKIYSGTDPASTDIDFFIIHGNQCPDKTTRVFSVTYYIQENGFFFDDYVSVYYGPEFYCIDYFNDALIGLICVESLEANHWNLLFYINVILSTICFAITAIMYSLILKENIILKKCVISFSSSMCIAFISLIVMNVQNNVSACHIFGFSFLTTTVFSFLWLPVSFFELFYLVIRPDHLQKDFRWNYYIGVTSAISVLILAVSLFSGTSYVPDIPNTFIRHPSSCQYMVEYERVFILFAPMIMSVAASGVLMFIITSRIRKNYSQEEIRNTYYWIQNGNHYTFMYRTYGFILLATLFWFAHLFYDKNVTQLPLDVLEAALGIITLAALVLNKYTRKEIYYYFKPAPPPEALNLGDLNTPNSPEREQEPFFSNNHAANANQPNR